MCTSAGTQCNSAIHCQKQIAVVDRFVYVIMFAYFHRNVCCVGPIRIMDLVRGSFEPDVIVLQCGADGLHDDPMDSFSLTSRGLGECVVHVLSWTVPTLILGGGVFYICTYVRDSPSRGDASVMRTVPAYVVHTARPLYNITLGSAPIH